MSELVAIAPPSVWMDNPVWSLYGVHPAFAEPMARFHARNRFHLRMAMTQLPELEQPAYWQTELERRRVAMEAGQAVHLIGMAKPADPAHEPAVEVGCLTSFWSIERSDFHACSLSILVDRQLEGRGLMYRAVAPAVEEVFNRYRLNRIMATHLPENLRSARFLRRLGFVVEGYARDFIRVNGHWRDNVLLSLLAPTRPGPP